MVKREDEDEEEDEVKWKARRNCFGITCSSQFSNHNSAVSVSQAVSVCKFLHQAVSVSQLHHVLAVSAIPPPISRSSWIARSCILIHRNTPEKKTWNEDEED